MFSKQNTSRASISGSIFGNFNLDHVPPKSRHGNKITSAVFRLLYGVYLPDTQTGLRAFRMADLPFMLDVPGERFEYEMQVLIACARAKLPLIPVRDDDVDRMQV